MRFHIRGAGGWGPTILIALAIGVGPLWLWRAPMRAYFLKFDDFVYLARSRTPDRLWQNLFRPHQGHVVPLFRIETFALAQIAGTLQGTPPVLGAASYATLLLAMILLGVVVARETGRAAMGLVAMSALGLSSVPGPTLLWYASGQAMAAGAMILAMLAALQVWRIGGSRRSLALAFLAETAAPLLWSGGFAAGPVGAAYLWADGRPRSRALALLLLGASAAIVALAWLAGAGTPGLRLSAIEAAVVHSSQALGEAIVLNNIGLDARTTPTQAIALVGGFAALWGWSRRGSPIRPLEAAGATMALGTLAMIFAARGVDEDFRELRPFGWYHAMADLGAILFACAWSARPTPSPASTIATPTRRDWLAVSGFAMAMLTIQMPRADRVVFEYAEMAAPMARPVAGSVARSGASDLDDQTRAQRAALAELDRLETRARRGSYDREAVRRAASAVAAMPNHLPGFDPAELPVIPDDRRSPHDPGADRR